MSVWTEEAAEWYAEKYGEYATNRLAVDRLTLSPSISLLDIGCGTGAALRHASARVVEGVLVGVDPVPRMVEITKERTKDHSVPINYLVGAAEELPVGDVEFDVVLAFDSFDHWQRPQGGLSEVRRVLKPTGLFAVVKDGCVEVARSFLEEVETAGFDVQSEEHVTGEGVEFTLWQCRPCPRRRLQGGHR